MRYTLWLDGHLLGETRLQHKHPHANQRLGALQPTAYGLELIPGMCGFLRAAAEVKKSLESIGVDPDSEPDRAIEMLERTPEGARFRDIVSTLGRLELRESGGERAPFHTVILTDLHELDTLSRGLGVEHTIDAEAEIAAGAPRFLVSATACPRRRPGATASAAPRPPWVATVPPRLPKA